MLAAATSVTWNPWPPLNYTQTRVGTQNHPTANLRAIRRSIIRSRYATESSDSQSTRFSRQLSQSGPGQRRRLFSFEHRLNILANTAATAISRAAQNSKRTAARCAQVIRANGKADKSRKKTGIGQLKATHGEHPRRETCRHLPAIKNIPSACGANTISLCESYARSILWGRRQVKLVCLWVRRP